ncbi:MAG TPA: hypothetical protein PLP12_19130 [Verrucomicrobiota bacterium]|jgi:hypothetical protein|nr:hypothetical protein [Verrucomicrobiota bacterium]
MSKSNIGDLIIGIFYFVSVCIGFVCSKPKLAFYLSVCLALGACAALFYLKIYVEMAGLFHTLPFAIIPWFISRYRQRRKGAGAVPPKGE